MTIRKQTASGYTLVPNEFLEKYMAQANGEFVKVYLYLLYCSASCADISLSSVADALNCTEGDVSRALGYWQKLGLLRIDFHEDGTLADITLLEDDAPPAPNRLERYAAGIANPEKVPRVFLSADRKKELSAKDDVRQLMYIAEQYLGKQLSNTEVTDILYFYDELHFSADLIEYLIEYCVSKGKRSPSYIRAVALEWAARGVRTVQDARKDAASHQKEFYAVMRAFGLTDRAPAQAEAEAMSRWFQEYGFSLDVVLEACRRTINRTHAPNFPYADRILKDWHTRGVTCTADIARLDQGAKKGGQGAAKTGAGAQANKFNNFPQRDYDYDALEQQLLQS